MAGKRARFDDHEDSSRKARQSARPSSLPIVYADHVGSPPAASPGGHGECFTHDPLTDNEREIRLLRMLPRGVDEDTSLRYTTSRHDFESVKTFTAISYTWGDAANQEAIYIHDKPFFVYRNCHHVLTCVYRQWTLGQLESDLVWIDSICINQSDSEEKSVQVSFMGDIYAKATQVLACIGDHAGDSEFLFEKLRETALIGYDCDDCSGETFFCSSCQPPWENWTLSLGRASLLRLCKALERFDERAYWTRVWIIQEVAKATSLTIVCGDDIVSWNALSNLEQFLGLGLDEIPSIMEKYKRLPAPDTKQMHEVFFAKREAITIEHAFSLYSKFSCQDPRDHLYGLLNLIVWPESMISIFPDYTKGVFDLAVQLEPFLSLEQIPEMLKTFRICSSNEEVKSKINQRRHANVPSHGQVPAEPRRNFKPLYRVDLSLLPPCAWLDVDPRGDLTTALQKTDDWEDSDTNHSISISTSASEDVEETEFISDEIEQGDDALSASSIPLSTQASKRIMLGSDVAGYICEEASRGDMLAPLFLDNIEVFLVLRRSSEELYDLIGQAVFFSGYRFGHTAEQHSEGTLPRLFEAQVELKIPPEDVVLLFAQDKYDDEDGYDMQAHWERVITSPTISPCRAARVTIQHQLHTQNLFHRDDGPIDDPFPTSMMDFILSASEGGATKWTMGPLHDDLEEDPPSSNKD